METELKFTFPAGRRPDIERLLRDRGLDAAAGSRRNDAVYFDTPDLALAAAGFSLRVRRTGRGYVQTLKSLRAAGGVAGERFEQEWRIGRASPDLDLLASTPASAAIGADALARVAPLFRTRIDRALYPIRFDGGSAIELAIDEGEIRAGEAALPVHELELELKEGPLEPLYRFAIALQSELPLTIGAESKAGRGFRLRSGRPPEALKSRAIALEPDVTVEEGLRRIVESGLGHFIANLPAISPDGDGEGVHQARVAIRRLRSALALFDGHLEPGAAARFERELQRLGRAFGAARDWDVFVIDTIPAAGAAGREAGWLDLLALPAEAHRRAAHDAVANILESRELTGFLVALAAWTAGALWIDGGAHGRRVAQTPLRELAPGMLDRLEGQVRRRGHRVSGHRVSGHHVSVHRVWGQSAEELHDLRKSFKKLRYAVEFFAGLYGARSVKRYREACEGVQEILGTINDTVATDVLAGRVADDPDNARLAPSIGVLSRWTRGRRKAALKMLPEAWDAFRRCEPFWR